MARLLKENKVKLPFGLYITNSVQEEVGLRCEMTWNIIKPDVAIVTDVTRHADADDELVQSGDVACGKGPCSAMAGGAQHAAQTHRGYRQKEDRLPSGLRSAGPREPTRTRSLTAMPVCPSALIGWAAALHAPTVESVHRDDVEDVIKLITRVLARR